MKLFMAQRKGTACAYRSKPHEVFLFGQTLPGSGQHMDQAHMIFSHAPALAGCEIDPAAPAFIGGGMTSRASSLYHGRLLMPPVGRITERHTPSSRLSAGQLATKMALFIMDGGSRMGIATVGKFTITSSYSSQDHKIWFGKYRITCDGSHIAIETLQEPFPDGIAAAAHALKIGVERAKALLQGD
ncbi:hypothetical protein [Dyella sedimenti]|uniref:hypothetical protein n=1 Tax=Dyella sedimenti TaxID=2919947 RepID=UPI001FA98418|nr:hypothetical protein [Dyella sedimenti]